MGAARNYLDIAGDTVFVFADGEAKGVHHSELLDLMRRSRSLAEVRKRFMASRSNLIETLDHFGYDFDTLLEEQFREGYRDAALAKLHRVDPKWIADKRQALGFPNALGRTRVEFSAEEVMRAYDAAGSFSGAARLLGVNRRTFRKLYDQASQQVDLEHDDHSDTTFGSEGLSKVRAATKRVGTKVCCSADELKKFFDDEWGG